MVEPILLAPLQKSFFKPELYTNSTATTCPKKMENGKLLNLTPETHCGGWGQVSSFLFRLQTGG